MNDPARDEALKIALLGRADLWKTAAARIRRLTRRKTDDPADAAAMADDYRMLAHDVAKARRLLPDSRAREYLEVAYAQAHSTLYRPAWHPGYALLGLFQYELPAVLRWLRPHIIWATALFILTVIAGYLMVHTYPDLVALFASPELIATVERGQLWTEGLLNVVPSSVLSLQILTNNIVVSVFAFCAGLLFGLGTFYIVALNGLMLGAIFAFTGQHGLDGELLRFIVAHGCVELPCMVLSGAAGAGLGEALARPAAGSRGAALRDAARSGGLVLAACVLLLVGAGFIEGYVSPRDDISFWARLAIGLLYGLFMVALLRGWLFRGSQACLRAPKSARSRRPLSDTPCAPQPLIRLEHGVRDGLLRRGDHGHAEVP